MPLTEPLVAPGRHDDGPATPAPVPARDGADRDEGAADVLLERIGLVVGLVIVLVEAALTIGRRSMWHDEAYTLAAVNDLGLSLSSTHGTMGLYYVGLWPWAQVSTAAWWLRLPSVLLALATLLVVRSIGRRIGGPRLAAVAVPLAALVPVFVHKATEARSYALVTFLVALAWWLVLPGTGPDDPRAERRRGVGLVAVGIAGTLAHGLFFVHLVPLVGLAVLLPRPRAAVVRTGVAVAASAAVAWGLRSGGASDVGVTFTGGLGEWASTTAGAYVAGPPLVQAAVVAMAASARGSASGGSSAPTTPGTGPGGLRRCSGCWDRSSRCRWSASPSR